MVSLYFFFKFLNKKNKQKEDFFNENLINIAISFLKDSHFVVRFYFFKY